MSTCELYKHLGGAGSLKYQCVVPDGSRQVHVEIGIESSTVVSGELKNLFASWKKAIAILGSSPDSPKVKGLLLSEPSQPPEALMAVLNARR